MSSVLEDQAEGMQIDPVTFEVIRHRLWAINDEQAMIAARVSGSPVVYEAYDFNAALLTPEGEGIVAGIYIVHHAVPIDILVNQIRERWKPEDIHEGDMFFTNDPWSGALHANDGILAAPIFWEGEIVCWTGMVLHDQDVGSPVPGSFVVGAVDRFGEAPLMPPIKMVERFQIRDDIEQAFLRNHRTPEFNALNMRARVAALSVTHRRIHELIEEYGKDTFLACQQEIINYTERVVRRRLREMPDGTWFEHTYLDHDGNNNEFYEIRLSLEKQDDRLVLDFTGTSPQAPGPINCARSGLEGAAVGVFFIFLCYDLPWSVGAARRVLEIVSEEGTVNNATSPAAVSMASVMGTWATQDVVSNAMAKMLLASDKYSSEAQSCWQPAINGHVIAGVDRHGEPFASILMDCCGGGGGARTFDDGIDTGGFMQSMSSTISNVETSESRYPVLQIFRRESPDSGGHGRFRGGLGLEYGLIPHKNPVDLVSVCFASGVSQPEGHGLSGGGPAAVAANFVLRSSNVAELFASGKAVSTADDVTHEVLNVLAAKDQTMLVGGDLHICRVPGGGGYGDPLRREPERVLADVLSKRASEAIARSVYGVVLADGAVDAGETAKVRDEMRRERLDEAKPVSDDVVDGNVEGTHLHPVADTVEAVETADGRRIRCTDCSHDLGAYENDYKQSTVMRERAITTHSPLNELGMTDGVVLREYYCPGCGTSIAVDVQLAGEPVLPEARFGASNGASARATA
jgi:N-methylhydantoinase B